MLVQIGIFIMAISFVIFAVALSRLLLRTSTSIETVRIAALQMEFKMDGTLHALEGTITETDETITDLDSKLKSIDSVFLSAEKFGDATNVMSEKLEDLTTGYASAGQATGTKPFIRIIQTAEFVKGIWKSWKRGQAL